MGVSKEDIVILKKHMHINGFEEAYLLDVLNAPNVEQYNGKAYLPKGLESIEKNIISVRWYKGDVLIETDLFYDRSSTSSKVQIRHNGGGQGIFHLTLVCDYDRS